MFDDDVTYVVVRNDQEQYSIWPQERPVPAGWWPVGFAGPKPACLAFVDSCWTDMRPRDLRTRMGGS